MLIKLTQILMFGLVAFFLSFAMYPFYIKFLKRCKAGKCLREDSATGEKAKVFNKLHKHKSGTPTVGGGVFLIVMVIMIALSYILKNNNLINNSLITRQETYIVLFGFFSMGFIGLIDDILNVRGHGKVKGLSAKMKLLGMFLFAGFISRWFYSKLGVDSINLRPIVSDLHVGLWYPIITFFITISIVNAINITDGLDGLAGGLMTIIFVVLATVTFIYGMYLSTTILAILIASLVAFMRFNINPAKIFMGDSGAFALGGLLSTLLFILNMKMGILIPFIIIFLIFILEVSSSGLQMMSKKFLKKKLFAIAPLHHFFEFKGYSETNIVMRAWLIQGILAVITIIGIFYQIEGTLPWLQYLQ